MLVESVQAPNAGNIARLSKDVVEKISAGEIIERPANLVKELIENSIDAGATLVEIDFSEAGRSIRVLDNASGIPKSELTLALERHATSKIRVAEDLWKLSSFGFRGEALASISAVSHLTITSRTRGEEKAWKIESHFGEVSEPVEASQGQGTEIRVMGLFENVPARLKFLKSATAEHAQIKRVIKSFALIWPGVAFKVRQENELIAYWPAAERAKRFEAVLGKKLNFTEGVRGNFTLSVGYSSPVDVEKTSQNIWVFVQKRWIQDKSIQAAVMEAYRNLLMHGEFPSAVIDLQVAPDEVDVNIHPTKSQVKFADASSVFRVVNSTLRSALEASVPKAPASRDEVPLPENLKFSSENFSSVQFQTKDFPPSAAPMGSPSAAPINPSANRDVASAEITAPHPNTVMASDSASNNLIQQETVATVSASFWSNLQVLGQANLTYILAQNRKAFFYVDQHAAHERIVFERLMIGFKSATLEIQNYLLPLVLNFEPEYVEAILDVREPLERIGLSMDQMGPESLAIRSAPALLKESAIEKVLFKIAKEKIETGESFALENVIGDIFATMACHSVIRAGQSLSHEEMKSLLSQMDEFPFSAFCPHGRPVYIEKSFSDIEREFGRIL